MKKLNVIWDNGVTDKTGYLFSFAKSLGTAVKNSPYNELAEDIIATSGFAFRMWIAADLCPSAMSIWEFNQQKPWVENGGLICDYVERMWGEDDIEEARRLTAIEMIKKSIDNGIAAISWDIGVPEWGLIIGYDDDFQTFAVLSVTGEESEMAYNLLGKRELPLLSVLTVIGEENKNQKKIIQDTIKHAVYHLKGKEWCGNNAKGLEAYPALISHFEEKYNPDFSWNMEYYLGTYAALKWFAYKFFEKYDIRELAELYKKVYECWQEAFNIKTSKDLSAIENRIKIADLLRNACEYEKEAIILMD